MRGRAFRDHDFGTSARGRAERYLGSLEVRKRADMILVRLDQPRAAPLYEAVSQLVYALKGSDVQDVMVNGKTIVRDRKMLTLDESAVLAKALEYRPRIAASIRH